MTQTDARPGDNHLVSDVLAYLERHDHDDAPYVRVLVMAAILVSTVPTSVFDRPAPRHKTLVPRWAIDALRNTISATEPELMNFCKNAAVRKGGLKA